MRQNMQRHGFQAQLEIGIDIIVAWSSDSPHYWLREIRIVRWIGIYLKSDTKADSIWPMYEGQVPSRCIYLFNNSFYIILPIMILLSRARFGGWALPRIR